MSFCEKYYVPVYVRVCMCLHMLDLQQRLRDLEIRGGVVSFALSHVEFGDSCSQVEGDCGGDHVDSC